MAARKKTIILKWALLRQERKGVKTRPPNENMRSTAALAGSPLLPWVLKDYNDYSELQETATTSKQ